MQEPGNTIRNRSCAVEQGRVFHYSRVLAIDK